MWFAWDVLIWLGQDGLRSTCDTLFACLWKHWWFFDPAYAGACTILILFPPKLVQSPIIANQTSVRSVLCTLRNSSCYVCWSHDLRFVFSASSEYFWFVDYRLYTVTQDEWQSYEVTVAIGFTKPMQSLASGFRSKRIVQEAMCPDLFNFFVIIIEN